MKEWFMKFRERFSNEPEAEFFQIRGFVPNLRAEIAIDMVKRFALVSAMDDGEDSARRAKLKLMPPEECVSRAIEIADRLVTAVEDRDWLEETPSYQEWLDKAMGAKEQKREESDRQREVKRMANKALGTD